MPDWAALTRILARDAKTVDGLQPPAVAQRYEQRFGRVQLIEAIRRSLHFDLARPGKAHLAFAALPFDTIYTTNFDLLLEDACVAIGRPFRSLVGEKQLPFHAGQTASSIIKMHGDLRHEEYVVITESDYAEFLNRDPVVATHLSAMLITRTPLFIGYSLSDPDFNSIRSVVRSRLGQFERMAYVVQFNYADEAIEKALDDKLHVISIQSESGESFDDLLEGVFLGISKSLDAKTGVSFRNSRPDAFEPLEVNIIEQAVLNSEYTKVVEATSALCFVMMPFDESFDRVYRTLIAPAARRLGLEVVRADEMSAPGFIMEQIRAAIMQSRLCIADISQRNPNVLFELGLAQASNKPSILLAQDLTNLPFDIAGQRVIRYGDEPEAARHELEAAIQHVLLQDSLLEAERLLESGRFRAAIGAASVVLEHGLKNLLLRSGIPSSGRHSLGQMARLLREHGLLPEDIESRLSGAIKVRNTAVHEIGEPTQQEAEFVLSVARRFA